MNRESDQITETDLHCLELRFASTRLQSPQMIKAMMHSIEANGQLTAVAAIEEAKTIRMLMQQFHCSQSAIARGIGRDVSWVNRRLTLIKSVSDDVLATICKGHLSTWAAARIIAPLARAKGEHCITLRINGKSLRSAESGNTPA